MNVLKGFCYCVTAATETTITDDNGLIFTVKAGEQGYFVASSDEVSVTGTCTIVQVRGNFNMPAVGSGSGHINGMYVEEGELKGNGFNIVADVTTVTKNLDTSNISDGSYMFQNCSKLTSWTVELPNLTNSNYMFSGCSGLASWTVDLPNLTNGTSMFNGCSKLTSFSGDLTNLTNGYGMFSTCSKLTSFNAETEGLKSLSDGTNMFQNCILDETSVLHILNTIPTYTSGTHKLHLGKRTNYMNSTYIADLLGTTTPIAAATNYSYKGWTITITT